MRGIIVLGLIYAVAVIGGCNSGQSGSAEPNVAGSEAEQANTVDDPNCSDFRKNPDGSWEPVRRVTITGPSGKINIKSGATLRSGVQFKGLDLAEWLDKNCG